MRNPLSILAKSPVPYSLAGPLSTWMGGLGRLSKRGQLAAMGSNGTLFSIVNVLSTSTASPEWHLHRKKPGAVCPLCDEPGVQLVEKHPALSVLNKPNDFFTRTRLFEACQQHVDLTGEGWVVIARSGSMPVELWPVRPDRMEIVASPEAFLLGYIYHGPGGEEVPLQREDVMNMMMPDPEDPYRGMGPVQSIMRTLDATKYSTEWNRNFFINGALPGGIIKVSRRMQDNEWIEFQQRWAASHKGVGNAHRVGILEAGAEWVDVKFSQKDMQFAEMATLDKDTIREAFGIAKFAVGIIDDVNRATAEASDVWFAKHMTVVRLDRWKSMLNVSFLPEFPGYDPNLSLVYASPVPEDREEDRKDKQAKVEMYVALCAAGVEPEEAARAVGLVPMRHANKEVAA